MLERFLPSVLEAASLYQERNRAPVEIIIVDDASTDDSVAYLQQQGFSPGTPSRILLRNESNAGFGASCNRGFAAARHPLALLLNNDVEIATDAIAPLAEHFSNADVFAVHCRVFQLETGRECGRGQLSGFSHGFLRVHQDYSAQEAPSARLGPLYSSFASGGSSMFDRQKFLALGGFEPLLAPLYWEDVEISYRAWKRGYTILYEPRSVVHHRVSSTTRTMTPGRLYRMQQRNRLIFHWIHLHDRSYMAQHAAWVLLLAITAPLRLQFGFLPACGAALGKLAKVRQRHAEEKHLAKRTDRDIVAIFQELSRRADIES